jgi:hypothetical protein
MKTKNYFQGLSGILWLLLIGLVLSACGGPSDTPPPFQEPPTQNRGALVSWGSDSSGVVSDTPIGNDFRLVRKQHLVLR